MNPSEALLKAVNVVGSKKELCIRVDVSLRQLNLMIQLGKVSPQYALSIMNETGVHVSELCPKYYPKYLFPYLQSNE